MVSDVFTLVALILLEEVNMKETVPICEVLIQEQIIDRYTG